MKPHAGIQQQSAAGQGTHARQEPVRAASMRPLADGEKQVIDSLRAAGVGLTAKQLAARFPEGIADLPEMLEALVERKLVCRLNTLIPTYSCRDADESVDVE